jgi:hypothetical protein
MISPKPVRISDLPEERAQPFFSGDASCQIHTARRFAAKAVLEDRRL